MSISSRLVVAAAALGTVSAGLVSGATVGTADARSTSSGATGTVEVLVKRNHTIVMPDVLAPGVTKLKISSRREAGFQIVQADPGYSKAEAARDITRAFNKNNLRALRRFERNVTFFGGLWSTPRKPATMWADLEAGEYWAVDVAQRRPDPAKFLTFTVGGFPTGGVLPGAVLVATGEHEWGKTTRQIPTRGKILFRNSSEANHFLQVVRLAKGKTMKDFARWVKQVKAGKESPPPFAAEAPIVDTGVISGGESMSLRYRLPAGRYVMVCWWPDADMDGAPHVLLGMYRGLRVG